MTGAARGPRFADLEAHARALLDAAAAAADPAVALRRRLPGLLPTLRRPGGRLFLASVGKASLPMLREAMPHLAGSEAGPPEATFVTSIPEHAPDASDLGLPGARVHACDHPTPTARNVAAARDLLDFLDPLGPDDTLLLLLSGGGSAHLTLPAADLSLDDLTQTNVALQRAGADIRELNTVRKHTERLKGGLLAAAHRGRTVALVLSDVAGDPLDVVASGPTVPDPTTYADALDVLDRRRLRARLPRVVKHLARGLAGQEPETPKPGDPRLERSSAVVIASSRLVLAAVNGTLLGLGFRLLGSRPDVGGPASKLGTDLAHLLRMARGFGGTGPAAWTFAGEPTVHVDDHPTPGVGGPSQELALAAAVHLDGLPDVAVLTYSTDGRDGPTDAAGGLITGATAGAIRRAGLHPMGEMARHNATPALGAARALIRTGPTGTNLNHIAIGLVY